VLALLRGVVPALVGLALSVAALPQAAAAPTISPLSGRPGTTVTVTGTVDGGGPVPVVVTWDGRAAAVCETAPRSCPGDPADTEFQVRFQVPGAAAPGDHQMVLCVGFCEGSASSWTFVVDQDPPLGIEAVTPERTMAGGSVEVKGFTGPCDDVGLVLRTPTPVAQRVTGGQDGAFVAVVTVPSGTFIGTYQLELRDGCVRVAVVGDKHPLEVVNRAPRPADDTATTGPGQAVDIPVGDNDVDPDGDDHYPTSVGPLGVAANGELTAAPNGAIRYLPRVGFTGQDRFRYRTCEVVDSTGRVDCGTATVTVTVQVGATGSTQGASPTTLAAGGSAPPTSGQVVGGVTSLGPATGGPAPTTRTAPPPSIDPGPAATAADDRWRPLAVLGPLLAVLVLAALAALAGRAERTRRQRAWTRQHVRGDPQSGPARTTVEMDARAAPSHVVRLQPHPDDGIQHLQEATP
jgi:Bacterial Ig domain